MNTIFVQLSLLCGLTCLVSGGHLGFFPSRSPSYPQQRPLLNYGSSPLPQGSYYPSRQNVGFVKPPGQSQPDIGYYPEQQPYSPPVQPLGFGASQPGHSFSYEVNDPDSGNHYGHREEATGNGGVSGRYFVRLPNGLLQTVIYTADEYGYRPQIIYQGKVNPIAY